MPPGQTIPMDLSFAIAKKVCTAQDIERLACAYLASKEVFDAEKAGREFGGVKAESFKRQIWVITKRIKDYKGEVSDAGEDHGNPATPKASGGKKRKSGTPSASAKGSVKKPKKARNEGLVEEREPGPAAAIESDGEPF